MRKLLRISALATLALGATALTAQAQAKTYGLIGGVSFATLNGSDANGGTVVDPDLGVVSVSKGSRTGFVGGIFVDIPAATSLVFEPQVLYSQKGVKYSGTVSGLGVDVTLKMDYIDVPLLLRYNLQTDGGAYFLLGPDVGFNVSCSAKASTSGASGSADCGSGYATSVTFGGVAGLGFQKDKIGIEGRYEYDFGAAIKDTNAKNAVWEILLRYAVK
jgi:hypothetical protein